MRDAVTVRLKRCTGTVASSAGGAASGSATGTGSVGSDPGLSHLQRT